MVNGGNKAWSPYLAGGLTGLAITLSTLFCDVSFGATPFYDWLSKIVKLLSRGYSLDMTDHLGRLSLSLGWLHYFALGIPLGALLGALLYREFKWQAVPPLWRARFGSSAVKRAVWAFIGAGIGMLGVRLASGCPSGLGLSGMIEFSLGGYIGMGAFFIGGVFMAWLLFRGWRGDAGEAGQ